MCEILASAVCRVAANVGVAFWLHLELVRDLWGSKSLVAVLLQTGRIDTLYLVLG